MKKLLIKQFDDKKFVFIDCITYRDEKIYHFANFEEEIFCIKSYEEYIPIKDEFKLNVIKNIYGNIYDKKIYDFIDVSRDKKVLINFDINLPIESQNISQETIEFISFLNLQYWCTDSQKVELQKIYDENEQKYQQKIKDNLEKSFNYKEINIEEQYFENSVNEQLALAEVKNNFIYRIINKIKNLFTKICK